MANVPGYPTCSDLSDAKPLFKKIGLFLKPLVKINVSIQLPKSKSAEYTISNHALIEAVKELAKPDEFCSVKTTKTALELVRLEAELEHPKNLKWILPRIEGQTIKLQGHVESAKVRASVARNDFPARHDWDSFFRDAKHMNELKAGERPDTIHILDLPTDWFVSKNSGGKPSEKLVCRIFEQFGAISAVDIPSNDPYRSQMKDHISGMKQFNFRTTNLFETYIQYKDYLSFVCAMDALRGMKLLKKEDDKAWTQVIKVDFDKTKHLSESSIRKRKLLRDKLMSKERHGEEKCQDVVENVVQTKTAYDTQDKQDVPPKYDDDDGNSDVSLRKILREEKLFLVAQRKLESIRLLSELLERVADSKSVAGNHPEKRVKSIGSVVKKPNPTNILYQEELEDGVNVPNIDSSMSFDGSVYNNRGNYNWRCRGNRFAFRRGRGRPPMRGRGYFNNMERNTWEDYSNQREGYHNPNHNNWEGYNNREGYNNKEGYNNREGYSNKEGYNNREGYNSNTNHYRGSYRRHSNNNFFNLNRDQDFHYNKNQIQSLYYRYFQSVARVKSQSRSRSKSRSRSRDRSRRRSRSRHKSRSRSRGSSRSRHRSRSRTRERTDSRHRTRSRSRSHSRRRRSRSKSHRRSRSHSKSKSSRRSNSRSRSWSSTRRHRSKSRSWSERRSRSHSRTTEPATSSKTSSKYKKS